MRKIPGIVKLKSCERFQAEISLFGEKYYLGLFLTRKEAKIAVLKKRIEILSKEIYFCNEEMKRSESK